MKRVTTLILLLAVVLGVGLALWAYTHPRGQGQEGGRGDEPVAVRLATVEVRPMPVLIQAQGSVEPEQSVAVRAQVSGVLQKVFFDEGDEVKAGQLLFEIDPASFQASVAQARAAVARDQAMAAEAAARERRLAPLVEKEYVTRQEYEQAAAEAKSARAVVEANRAAQREAELQLARTRIVAPISGRTGSLGVKPGNLVAANSAEPLVTINTVRAAVVSFRVPQQQLTDVRRHGRDQNLRVEVFRDDGRAPVANGTLTFIDNSVDPATGTVRLKARVDNRDEVIWPGEFVLVRLVLDVERDAVVVPEAAVQPGQDGSFVYVIEEGRARQRPIEVARQIEAHVVVAGGLKGGEQVVLSPPQQLRTGSEVRVLPTGPAAARAEQRGRGGA